MREDPSAGPPSTSILGDALDAPFALTSPAFELGSRSRTATPATGRTTPPPSCGPRRPRGRARSRSPWRTRTRPSGEFVHWLGVGARAPPARAAGGRRAALRGSQRLSGRSATRAPARRPGDPPHEYVFRLFALGRGAGRAARLADGGPARVPRRGADRGGRADGHLRPPGGASWTCATSSPPPPGTRRPTSSPCPSGRSRRPVTPRPPAPACATRCPTSPSTPARCSTSWSRTPTRDHGDGLAALLRLRHRRRASRSRSPPTGSSPRGTRTPAWRARRPRPRRSRRSPGPGSPTCSGCRARRRSRFVTGCQMAHVTALAAARHRVLADAG